MVLGLDLGFGRVKAALGGRVLEFPALVSPVPTLDLGEVAAAPDRVLVDPDGRRWFVGDDARSGAEHIAFSAGKAGQVSERAKFLRALADLLGDRTDARLERIVASLPVHELRAEQETLRQLLAGVHRFSLGARRYTVTAADVRVIPQGAGAYYALALRDGHAAPDAPVGRVCVLDVGYRTMNVVALDGGRYAPDRSGTLDVGVSRIHLELQRRILRDRGYAPDVPDLDRICRTGLLPMGGRELDVSLQVAEASQGVAEQVVEEAQLYLGDPRRYASCVLAGGGTHLVRKWIERVFPGTVIPPNPSHANAVGQLEYGMLLSRRAANRA